MMETDVLIIGGGPAGATLAKLLSQNGLKNSLVQRKLDFKKPCGGGIRKDAFDEFDISLDLVKKEVDTIGLVYKDMRIDVDISQTPLVVVDRVEFDQALRDEAANYGTKVYEATFISLDVQSDYVLSRIKKGDNIIEIRSRYVIGADGVNSKVRKLVNNDSVSSILTHYADISSQETKSCDFHFGKKVAGKEYAWNFPHVDGSNIGTVTDDHVSLQVLKSNLNITEDTKDLGYKIPVYDNQIFYKDRIFFVGDSASQVLPFTYEGIYYAMSSAEILANTLINDLDPQTYEIAWKKKYKKKFDTLLRLQKIFLYNDFMIRIMMHLYKSSFIKKSMIELWLGKRELEMNFHFFYKVMKLYLFSWKAKF